MTDDEKKLMFSYEALDYDPPVNELFRHEFLNPNELKRQTSVDTVLRWCVYAAIGLLTGTLAFLLSWAVEKLSDFKFDRITDQVSDGRLAGPFVEFLLINVAFVSVATFLVAVVEPVAGGSGIPQIKAYLNGTNYNRFLRAKTLACKALGVVFSVSAGLFIGKEGPLVHSGAVIAANLSNATWINELACWSPGARKWVNHFRNDRSKRDFVAGGAAAGVAAAFGAPVGGILFALEEASSFWDTQLTWMCFLAAMLGTFTLNILKAARDGRNNLSGLISFGPALTGSAYHLWELPFFVGLAVFGGLAGALFNHVNEKICKWRRDSLAGKKFPRMAEALLVTATTAVFAFWLPLVFEHCSSVPTADMAKDETFYARYRCGKGEFNTMASVLFTTTEVAIKGFFHNTAEYRWDALLAYFVVVFVLAVVTYGIAVPSGLFVPCILAGCAFGRMVGEGVRLWFPDEDVVAGTYAIVGATAMLGGVSRMTISLTVILLETTQDIELLLPIMATLMVAKWVGDTVNISLYDLHVELYCMPFVECKPSTNMYHLSAVDVMRRPVRFLPERCTVRQILELMDRFGHNGFPVVQNGTRQLTGLVLRNQLAVLLNRRVHAKPPARPDRGEFPVSYVDFATSLSSKRVPIDLDLVLQEDGDDRLEIDLAPYMTRVPMAVQPACPLSRVFVLFRSLGLRHLCVVNHQNMLVGIITRKEIMSSFDNDLF